MKISFNYTNELVNNLLEVERSFLKIDSSFSSDKDELKRSIRLDKLKYAFLCIDSSFSSFDFEGLISNKDLDYSNNQEMLIKRYSNLLDFLEEKKEKKLDSSLLLDSFSILSPNEEKSLRKEEKDGIYSFPLPFTDEKFIPAAASKLDSYLSILFTYLNENDLPLAIKEAICFYYLLSLCPFRKNNILLAFAFSSFYSPFPLPIEKQFYLNSDKFLSSFSLGLPNYFDFAREDNFSLEIWINYYLECLNKAILSLFNVPKAISKQSSKDLLLGLNKKDCILISYCIKNKKTIIKNNELALLYNVTPRAISKWAKEWVNKGILIPESGQLRTTSYRFSTVYAFLKPSELNSIK